MKEYFSGIGQLWPDIFEFVCCALMLLGIYQLAQSLVWCFEHISVVVK